MVGLQKSGEHIAKILPENLTVTDKDGNGILSRGDDITIKYSEDNFVSTTVTKDLLETTGLDNGGFRRWFDKTIGE